MVTAGELVPAAGWQVFIALFLRDPGSTVTAVSGCKIVYV
jgi:hypothetical protein